MQVSSPSRVALENAAPGDRVGKWAGVGVHLRVGRYTAHRIQRVVTLRGACHCCAELIFVLLLLWKEWEEEKVRKQL